MTLLRTKKSAIAIKTTPITTATFPVVPISSNIRNPVGKPRVIGSWTEDEYFSEFKETLKVRFPSKDSFIGTIARKLLLVSAIRV